MAATQTPNHRASLLSGLRTGGVRSMSGSMMMNSPHTAAPGGGFNIHRYPSQYDGFYEEDEDEMGDLPSHNQYNHGSQWPMTAAIDGAGNRFSNQQSKMNANSAPFVPGYGPAPQSNQNQALHDMQMLQMEVMRLQAVQAQQYQANAQANYLAEMVRQQQAAQGGINRRASLGYNPPASAGPTNNTFDLRAAAMSAQARRANQADMLKAQLGIDSGDAQVPMSAALGGKFGGRSVSGNQPFSGFADRGEQIMPSTPGYTTVISGGTPLGSPLPAGLNNNASTNSTPSKSDTAVSWRRNGNNNSVLSGNRSFTLPGSPTVKVTPPPPERVSPPPGLSTTKARPLPLRFSISTSPSISAVSIDPSSDGVEAVEVELPSSSSSSSRSDSLSPTTPPSSGSQDIPLSPREEASKKLYEGLGIGRPVPGITFPTPPVASHRMASQPMRQPRGPPSGADELGPKNFATRIRRKAIGGLGVLMGARERRISMIEEC
ncbi:hypothetical protein HWV62_7824 [Athelia sp. TMB]|nr:hypothetical protein HWV62_41162 [Athelia sp. TMB]KAF7981573.1 hypothetical protein HWV62_32604 [Athelia sp. TMB]KAF7985204.1 hypothetical protein HWV62_7824 [Athelia sp. TMB]